MSVKLVVDWSELALATLAVARIRHTLSHKGDELARLHEPLRLRAATDTLAVHEHSRYLQPVTLLAASSLACCNMSYCTSSLPTTVCIPADSSSAVSVSAVVGKIV